MLISYCVAFAKCSQLRADEDLMMAYADCETSSTDQSDRRYFQFHHREICILVFKPSGNTPASVRVHCFYSEGRVPMLETCGFRQ